MVERAQEYTRSQRSQAMTEFALIGPILLLIILLIIDFGRGIYYFVTIDNAANEGARVAVRSSAQPTGAGASTLPTNADVVAAIQNRTAAVFLSHEEFAAGYRHQVVGSHLQEGRIPPRWGPRNFSWYDAGLVLDRLGRDIARQFCFLALSSA